MTIDQLKENLEPHWDNLDYIVDEIIRQQVTSGQFKFFDACRYKIKAIWYIQNNIISLDKKYNAFLSQCISEECLDTLSFINREDWGKEFDLYFPFREAIEFENLLIQGKACLDCFSKAIGSMYEPGGPPKNIKKLVTVLKKRRGDVKVDKMLEFIEYTYRLDGVILDPIRDSEKSLRDLITHYERIDIFHTIHRATETGNLILSDGALVNMRHSQISKLPNYLVENIALKVWFIVLGIVENCFKVQFGITS